MKGTKSPLRVGSSSFACEAGRRGKDQQNILIARYVSGEKWERIAVDLNFSIAQVYRIHGAALLDFAEKNPDILKDDSKREYQT